MFYVYLLVLDNLTYVGATTDVFRRLQQHNSEKSGGARRTTAKSVGGEKKWRIECYVEGFPTWNAALQFEWRWKQLTRQLFFFPTFTPLEKRKMALEELLSLEKPTNNAIPYAEYENKLVVKTICNPS
jgi:structure-specific endonuclease subunit SLX1